MVPQQRRRRRRAAVSRTSERRIVVARGPGGFGFTIAGQRPCVVSAVATGGPAERAGLRAGDALLAVDGASVARAPHTSVARLVAAAPSAIALSVAPRDAPPTDTEDTEPDERSRTRRRHPPPRRRPQPLLLQQQVILLQCKRCQRFGHSRNQCFRPFRCIKCAGDHSTSLCTKSSDTKGTCINCSEKHPASYSQFHATCSRLGCHAAPNTASTSGVNEILQNLNRAQLSHNHIARLECRAVVGYLGTIETPQAASNTAPNNVKNAIRKLRQERRQATPVLLSVLPNSLLLRRPNGHVLAEYPRDRIIYVGCGSDTDRRYFGLVTSAEVNIEEASHSSHVFAVDPRLLEHEAHIARAREFHIACSRDPVAERCLEFPPSAEYVVGVIRGMYSLSAEDCSSPSLLQISKLAVKSDSPAIGNFSRNNRAMFRAPRDRRPRNEERADGQEFVANSPQPSNHSEVTTTSSNSDSGIGFHNDGRNIADRILVVEFARNHAQSLPNRFCQEAPRRPLGLVGFDDGSFLSNTTPVVDGFAGQGRPLNLDDVLLNANDIPRHVSPRKEDDTYNYNLYSNVPSTSRAFSNGVVYDQVYTENEGHYEFIPSQLEIDLDVDAVSEAFNSVEIYEERRQPQIELPRSHHENDIVQNVPCNESDQGHVEYTEIFPSMESTSEKTEYQSSESVGRQGDYYSNESVETMTVVSQGTSKASADTVSVYSSRSHEEARPSLRKHLQASLDDMLVIGMKDQPKQQSKDDDNFVHPSTVKYKPRKSLKPLNLLSKTRHMLGGKDKQAKKLEVRTRALSASAGDVCCSEEPLPAAASEPDLSRSQSEQSSPFRRWTTGSGAGSSYRHHDVRNMYNKQYSDSASSVSTQGGGGTQTCGGGGGVARWSLGLEQLLADPAGAAAFAHFLSKEFAAENIRFWWSCEQYRQCADGSRRADLAQDIWTRHLGENASDPVNVDSAARRATALRMHLNPPPADLFQQCASQIFHVMKFDSYPRFLKSSVHAECARADLRGLPLPYAPHSTNGGAGEQDSNTPKLKKSASNASERRRSGGLLPWRMRAASRDRAPAPDCNVNPNSDDVVKSSQSVPGTCSLCRVILPDGATSVVPVDANITVRSLVDRLLQKRKLQCNTYDVLLKDCNQGESKTVEPSSLSSVLGGRVISVERRCIVRVELGGRGVAVRCGANRPLRHVLGPLLRRYPAPSHYTVLRDLQPVSVDTDMAELDGSRLQIVETSSCPQPSRGLCGERDEDGDSLSDLNIRMQEDLARDDTQSVCSSVRSMESGASSERANGFGRVRAALRPGVPLHQHPPVYLDDLRETQRVRLLAPRAPPPLPPKPATRSQPTVV